MLAVAPEQLVRTHPGQDHLDASRARCLAYEQRVDRRRLADRFIEHVDDARQEADDFGRDLDLMQADAEVVRHLPRVDRVVRHGLEPLVLAAESDRIGVDTGVEPMS